MMHLPVIERQCSHSTQKVIRREYFDDFMITAIDLCKDCLTDPLFSEKDTFVDKKIMPRKKLNTKTALKKAIIQRKKEIQHLDKRKGEFLTINDSLKKLPKLAEYYMDYTTLSDDLNQLYRMYIEVLEKQIKGQKLNNL